MKRTKAFLGVFELGSESCIVICRGDFNGHLGLLRWVITMCTDVLVLGTETYKESHLWTSLELCFGGS